MSQAIVIDNSNGKKKKRNLTLDIARAFCVLWIVGVWHLQNYFDYIDFVNEVTKMITSGVLATFTFLSGLFLGKKKISAIQFYQGRLKRFYVLFFVAAILMFLGGGGAIKDVKSFILLVVGLNCFHMPPIRTLWYMGMLMFFYALVPIICYRDKSITYKLASIALIHAILVGWYMFFYLEYRFLLNFTFFSLGLLTPFSFVEKLVKNKMFFLISFLLIIVLFFFEVYNAYLCCPLILVVLICFSDVLKRIDLKCFNILFSRIAYGGLCAYLFHRLIYVVFRKILGSAPNIIWAPIMLLTCLLVAIAIQQVYDYVCEKMDSKLLKQ